MDNVYFRAKDAKKFGSNTKWPIYAAAVILTILLKIAHHQ